MRWLWPALAVIGLAACGSTPAHRPATASTPVAGMNQPSRAVAVPLPAAQPRAFNPCAPTREHRDSDYTPGGLYAPGVSDSGPAVAIDVSAVREPVPRDEPRSRYGNRSPYTVLGKSYRVLDRAGGYAERGLASWYGVKFNGRATSSGELYDMCLFSAAHKTLPLPSFVRVTNLDNGRSLIVRVNDRGPFHSGRVMDLSYAAAVRLGVDRAGTAHVQLQAISGGETAPIQLANNVRRSEPRTVSVPVSRNVEPVALATARNADNAGQPGRRIVQVGSFGEQVNARRLVDRLNDAGVDGVDLAHDQVGGQDVWRVRVGPVAWENLQPLLDRLRLLDLPNPRVFRE